MKSHEENVSIVAIEVAYVDESSPKANPTACFGINNYIVIPLLLHHLSPCLLPPVWVIVHLLISHINSIHSFSLCLQHNGPPDDQVVWNIPHLSHVVLQLLPIILSPDDLFLRSERRSVLPNSSSLSLLLIFELLQMALDHDKLVVSHVFGHLDVAENDFDLSF